MPERASIRTTGTTQATTGLGVRAGTYFSISVSNTWTGTVRFEARDFDNMNNWAPIMEYTSNVEASFLAPSFMDVRLRSLIASGTVTMRVGRG